MKYMNSVADALILQYYEVPDDLQAAFGYELTEDDWRTIGNVLATYEKILFTAPYNRDYDAEGNGMIRVHNWDEIVSVIDRME